MTNFKHLTDARPARIALVGAGRIAQSHLEAIAVASGLTLAAVVEPRAAAGQAVAEQKRVPWFERYDDPRLLELVDAVLVCAPPNVHHAIAKWFLEHDKHVLCEKPLTITSVEADQLVGLAKSRGLELMMASKFRYVDDLMKAKALIEAGILGKIVLFENTFCGKVVMKDRWNAQRESSGGGVLIDNGTHSIDIARYLLGPIESVQAQAGVSAQGLEVEDTVRMQFRTRAGVIGSVDLSWSIAKDTDAYVSVYGSDGTIVIGWQGSRYRQDGNPKWVAFGTGYEKTTALRRQLENFVGVMRGTELPLITPDDAVASVRAIETAYASMRHDHWVPVAASIAPPAGKAGA